MSKGSKRRPTDEPAFRENYPRVYRNHPARPGKLTLVLRKGSLKPKDEYPVWHVPDLTRQPLVS